MQRGLLVLIVAVMLSAFAFAVVLDEDADEYCYGLEGTTAGGAACPSQLDCNDNNPLINPGEDETPGDGIDNDCNGIIDDACTDSDMDGYNSTADANGVNCGGAANVDCDDANIFVNPGITEICGNDIDDDCDGDADADDSDCSGGAVGSTCEIDADYTMWINCDGENINAANEGDTVYMLLWTEGCDESSDVTFKVYESSGGVGTEEDSIEATEVITNILDSEGNPTDIDVWLVPWVASYIADDDDTSPEYYFEATLREETGASFKQDSGKSDDVLLSVAGCDGCGIECTLDLEGMFGSELGNGSGTGMRPPCQKTADCSNVPWSECDETGRMTRDTSLCALSGTGPVECEADVLALVPAERLCSSSANPMQKSFGSGEAECGDGVCDENEDAEMCPEDCAVEEAGFPWWWILVALIIVGAVTTGIIIAYKKKTKAAAVVAKPGEKKEEMPFAAQKDLDAILAYIRAAKGKGYTDAQITEALKKAGWKDDQIKYAFNKINNPQQAMQKPVTVQNPAQPIKK